MKLLFLPVIAVMNRLSYPLKMLLILVLFALPTGTVMVLLYQQIEASVEFSKAEQQGVEYLRPLRSTLEHLVTHENLVADIIAGNAELRKELHAEAGTPAVWSKIEGGVVLKRYEDVIAEVQQHFCSIGSADDVWSETLKEARRAESRLE